MTIADFQRTYSLMGDQELLNLALEIDDLTEEAKAALSGELAKRGLGAREIGEQAEVIQSLKNSNPLGAVRPEDPHTSSGITTLALGLSDPAFEASRQGMTRWMGEDSARLRLGAALSLLFFVAVYLYVWFSPNPNAAESAGSMVGRILVGGIVGFFLMRRSWGKGSALLITSSIALLIFGYLDMFLLLNRGPSAKTDKVSAALLSDIQKFTESYKAEVGPLNVQTALEMLDGRRASTVADLVEMKRRSAIANDKTDQYLAIIENRVKNAATKIDASDPSSAKTFNEAIGTAMVTVRRVFLLNKEYFTEIDGLLEFVLSRNGTYQITGRGIQFHDARDLSEYDRRVDKINEVVASTSRLYQQK